MYNSAGRFSTPLKTFSSGRVFRPSIEQGASPPVLWSRGGRGGGGGGGGGLRLLLPGVSFFPVALASAVIWFLAHISFLVQPGDH